MQRINGRTMLGLTLVAVACSLGGCKRSEPEHNEVGREVGQVELTSGEPSARPEQPRADENSYLGAVRREQLTLTARVREEIESVDVRLAALRSHASKDARPSGRFVVADSKKERRVRALLERRSELEQDLATVQRADERGWDELKANVERDLAEPTADDRR